MQKGPQFCTPAQKESIEVVEGVNVSFQGRGGISSLSLPDVAGREV